VLVPRRKVRTGVIGSSSDPSVWPLAGPFEPQAPRRDPHAL